MAVNENLTFKQVNWIMCICACICMVLVGYSIRSYFDSFILKYDREYLLPLVISIALGITLLIIARSTFRRIELNEQ